MSGQRIRKLLEVAGRSTSNENEALNAIRMVGGQLKSLGLEWEDLPTLMGTDPTKIKVREVVREDPALRARVEDLERLLRASEASVTALQQELRRANEREPEVVVREVIREVPKVKYVDRPVETHVVNDVIQWGTFQRLARNILGGEWRDDPSRFGASPAMLKRWESTGQVPVGFLDKLARTHRIEVKRARIEPKKKVDIRV